MRPFALTVTAVLILLLLAVFPPWGTSLSQNLKEVLVVNFPDVQKVRGEVKVAEIVRQAEIHRRLDLIVPSVPREDVTDLVDAGSFSTDGFSQVTGSFHGEARGAIEQEGWIGVVMLPEEAAVQEMLDDHEAFHFPIEARAQLVPKGPVHFQVQQRIDLGFPRYKVYLYNSTDRTADVHVYLYLTQ